MSSIFTTGISAQTVGAVGNVISGHTGIHTLSLNDLGFNVLEPHIKKYQIYEFDEDILAISVAWKRLRDNGIPTSSRITDYSIRKQVTHDDKEKANKIADYYSKKLMVLALKGKNNISSYRKDLSNFVHSDRMKVTENMFGLSYHLPTFYEHDIELDFVKSNLNNKPDWKINHGAKSTLKVYPVKKIRRKTKSIDNMNYWFKTEDNVGLNITVSTNNNLSNMWDYLYHNSTSLVLQGMTRCKELDGFEYLMLSNWHIVKD